MSSPPTLPISLVVIPYNEAANIARCLDSVPFAAEKIVVDCGSDDDTRAIAAAATGIARKKAASDQR